jgi:hypothetical protein
VGPHKSLGAVGRAHDWPPMQRVLPRRPRMLIFDVVRLSAPVPWLSGRASASHAEGRWFDPSRDHIHRRWSEGCRTAVEARAQSAGPKAFARRNCSRAVNVDGPTICSSECSRTICLRRASFSDAAVARFCARVEPRDRSHQADQHILQRNRVRRGWCPIDVRMILNTFRRSFDPRVRLRP